MAKLPVVHDRHAVVRSSMGQAVAKQILVQHKERAELRIDFEFVLLSSNSFMLVRYII